MRRMPVSRQVTAMAVVALASVLVVTGCGSVGSRTPAAAGDQTAAGGSSGGATPPWTPAVSAPPTPSPTATPTVTPTRARPSATPAPERSATPVPTATTAPRTTLVRGDAGPRVRELQERLTELGYWLGTPDGSFGSLTQQAVYALQKAAGIRRDGVVGPKTRRALAAGIRPQATLGGNGVEIMLDRQLLLVVRGGDVRMILNTSTGNGEEYTSTAGNRAIATTPRGSFAVYRAVDGSVTNSLGVLYRPRFFLRGYAVHGSPNIPPWPASHGCARLSNSAIDMIWARDLMPIGSRVLVH